MTIDNKARMGGIYPMTPKASGERAVALEVIVDESLPHVGQIMLRRGDDMITYAPASEVVKELEMRRFSAELIDYVDDIFDSNLGAKGKAEKCLMAAAKAVGAGYAILQIPGHEDISAEIRRQNGGFVPVEQEMSKYLDNARKDFPQLSLAIETRRDKVHEIELPKDEKNLLNGFGVITSLKPGEGVKIGNIQFLNLPEFDEMHQWILSRFVKFFDSRLAGMLNLQSSSEWEEKGHSLATLGLDHMQMGEIYSAEGVPEERTEEAVELVPIDQEGVGYCLGSLFERKKKIYEERFNKLLENIGKTGLGNIKELYENSYAGPKVMGYGPLDFNLARQISMTIDAVMENINVGDEIDGQVIFKNEEEKKLIAAAARTVGALCLLPKYIGKKAGKFSKGADFGTYTALLHELIVEGEKFGIPVTTRDYNGAAVSEKRKIQFARPDFKEWVEHFAKYIDGIPGNNIYTGIVEAVMAVVDQCLQTNYSGPSTVNSSLKEVEKTGYSRYLKPIRKVLTPLETLAE